MPNFVSVATSVAQLAQSINQSITHSVTHPAYLMPQEPKLSLRNIFFLTDCMVWWPMLSSLHCDRCYTTAPTIEIGCLGHTMYPLHMLTGTFLAVLRRWYKAGQCHASCCTQDSKHAQRTSAATPGKTANVETHLSATHHLYQSFPRPLQS